MWGQRLAVNQASGAYAAGLLSRLLFASLLRIPRDRHAWQIGWGRVTSSQAGPAQQWIGVYAREIEVYA